MKTNILKIAVMMFVVAGSFCSCEKWINDKFNDYWYQYRIFECYLNGEFMQANPCTIFSSWCDQTVYDQSSNILTIQGSQVIDDQKLGHRISLEILNPEENTKVPLNVRYAKTTTVVVDHVFPNGTTRQIYCDDQLIYAGENTGEIQITQFDIVNGIVKGTFTCEIPLIEHSICDEPTGELAKDSIMKITQGHFSRKFKINN